VNIYINKSNWKIYKKSSPFPFAKIEDFIKLDIYKNIKKNFPKLEDFRENGDIFANNVQIRKSFKEFALNKNSFWHDFGHHFVSNDFFYNYCEFFKDDIKKFYPQIYQCLKNRNLKIGVSGIDEPEKFDVILDFQLGINTPVIKKKSVRGPHLDNSKELYAGLCYLKDSDDYTDSGHFTVFEKKKFSISRYEKGRSIFFSDIKEVKKIKYKSNTLATFLNTEKSIHAVSEREVTNSIRKFFVFNAVLNKNLIRTSFLKKFFNYTYNKIVK
jgi:hypothetical protein